jgi:hypothetical protein
MRVKKEALLKMLAFIADIASIAGLIYILISRYG